MSYIAIARKSTTENMNALGSFPIYGKATFDKIVSCKTADEIRNVIREAKPINVGTGAKLGIMKLNVGTIDYTPIEGAKNVITFDGDDVVLSQGFEPIGTTKGAFVLKNDESDEIRTSLKSATFFFLME